MSASLKLTPEQMQTLKRQGQGFKIWINTEKGKKKVQEHRDHQDYFKEKLSRENLTKITENEFSELWQKSWASGFWSNKEWYVKERLVGRNGIDTIRQELNYLLYGEGDFAARYDRFRRTVKGFGKAILSEFLNTVFPNKFCVWNDKPKKALPFLKLDVLPTRTGEQYFQCINYLTLVKNELSEFGIRDFVDLDVFFWYIFEDVMPAEDEKPIEKSNLEDLIVAFDKDRYFFGPHTGQDAAMKLRGKFVSDFAPDKISEMNIDEYVFGRTDAATGQTDKNSFCYRLEFGIPGFGSIRGTPNNKFGIYCDKKTQEYVYEMVKYDSPESAFKAVKSQIQVILDAGKQVILGRNWKNFSEILEGEFDIMRHIRSKILSVYYPNNFLQLHSNKDAERILRSLFGLKEEEIDNGLFSKQAKLLELKDTHPIMKKWSNIDYSTFIWDASEDPRLNPIENQTHIFTTGYPDVNLRTSKVRNVLGWVNQSKFLSGGSLVFVFNKDALSIETCFKIKSQSSDVSLIWADELAKGRTIYSNRWNAEVIYDNLNITLAEINSIPPFNHEKFQGLLRGNFPMALDTPLNQNKYSEFRNVLLERIKSVPNLDYYSINHLVNDTFMESKVFEEWSRMLHRKKQMILIGPPGTGKTFVAKAFARYLMSGSGLKFRLVQFHPSYSYEDFLEGIKPKLEGNNITYEIADGKFKKICEEVSKPENKNKTFVLIIDEINRGQTPRIFGELIHALEYRGEPIPLLYSNSDFRIPNNLILIGTMNSTDRSIAFLDYAIRRRFWFCKLEPSESILFKYLQKHKSDIPDKLVIDLFKGLNLIIEEQLDEEFKIGHSYFMLENLNIEELEMVWNYEIKPLLKEYFFNDESKVKRCQELFDDIEKKINEGDVSENGDSDRQIGVNSKNITKPSTMDNAIMEKE